MPPFVGRLSVYGSVHTARQHAYAGLARTIYALYIHGSGKPYTYAYSKVSCVVEASRRLPVYGSMHTARHHAYVGLARTIYGGYVIFGRDITKYTVIYSVHIRFWPTLGGCLFMAVCTQQGSMRMQHAYAACECSMRMQHAYAACLGRVGQNHICTVYTRFWPTLYICVQQGVMRC